MFVFLQVTAQEWEQDVALSPLLGEQNNASSVWYYLYLRLYTTLSSKSRPKFLSKTKCLNRMNACINWKIFTNCRLFCDQVFIFKIMHFLLLLCTHALMSGRGNDFVTRLSREILNLVLITFTKFKVLLSF